MQSTLYPQLQFQNEAGDFYLRMIKSGMFKGSFTKADELVGEVQSGGYSSSISFYEHLKGVCCLEGC